METSYSLNEYEKFFERYDTFVTALDQTRFTKFELGFKYMRASFESFHSLYEGMERKIANGFNIFSVLGVGHYEVTTHSAFLADLLNPKGCHSQGDLFLKGFFDKLRMADLPTTAEIGNQHWQIQKEKVTSFGNLDIVVVNPQLNYAIVIENKIYAKDQEDQLKRYDNWFKKSQYIGGIVYLTLDGRPSRDADNEGVQYSQMSYREDIKPWLEHASKSVLATRVLDILRQYIQLIETL